jgi:hypothetical protein
MKRERLVLLTMLGLIMLTQVSTSMAQDCAQVFKGAGQDKLIQDIRTCSQDVRASTQMQVFTAYLKPENCHISIRTWQGDFYNKGTQQFIECMGQYGWKILFNSPFIEINN